jgi:hypothetical protein
MLTHLRDTLYRAITSPRGDALAAVRVPKALARRLNAALGLPLAARDELARRAGARERLAELRGAGGTVQSGQKERAPVLVYVERDRNVRELERIEQLLRSKGLAWKRLDVAGDDATLDFVVRKAKCQRDELPVVFVADRPIGGYEALVQADLDGGLERLVKGA